MKALAIACIALVVLVAAGASAYRHYFVRPLPLAKPSPRQQVSPSPQPRAVIAADPATPAPSPELPPDQVLVSFSRPDNDIKAIIPAPGEPQVLVLTANGENGEDESYSLRINLVDLRAKVPKITEIVSGSNAEDLTVPVWSADSRHVYYEPDNEGCFCAPLLHGIYDFDMATGKSTRLVNRPVVGLAISPDGQLLAFWDYSLGNVLTVYSIPRNEVLRRWEGQAHIAGEFFLRDMAFALDGKSLLAETSAERRMPLKEFNLETGDVRTVSENAPFGPVLTSHRVYFIEADEYTAGTDPHYRLKALVRTGAQPELVLTNFPYPSIHPAGDPRWIAASGSQGTLLYDPEARSGRTAGRDCFHVAMLSDGRAVYGVNGGLVADANLCGTPAPGPPAF